MNKPIICVDFDNCLHSYTSGWQGAEVVSDPPVPGAIDWLFEAIKHFDVCIYSSRSKMPGGISAMRTAIERWEAQWRIDRQREGLPAPRTSLALCLKFSAEKPAAFLTIDDRALTFNGDWSEFDVDRLLAFKPWDKR